jgi:Flp pilus assembly protein TadG
MTASGFRLTAPLAGFADDCRGVAAVEFALLLPMMLGILLGSVSVSQGIATDRKVAITAHAIADISSQYTSINNAEMTNILNASSAIIAPYSVTNLQAVVSEISVNAQGQASVVWSDALNGTARPTGQAVTIPSALAIANSYLILGEVTYNYDPTFGYAATEALTLSDQIYVRPRQSTSVTRTSS